MSTHKKCFHSEINISIFGHKKGPFLEQHILFQSFYMLKIKTGFHGA